MFRFSVPPTGPITRAFAARSQLDSKTSKEIRILQSEKVCSGTSRAARYWLSFPGSAWYPVAIVVGTLRVPSTIQKLLVFAVTAHGVCLLRLTSPRKSQPKRPVASAPARSLRSLVVMPNVCEQGTFSWRITPSSSGPRPVVCLAQALTPPLAPVRMLVLITLALISSRPAQIARCLWWTDRAQYAFH